MDFKSFQIQRWISYSVEWFLGALYIFFFLSIEQNLQVRFLNTTVDNLTFDYGLPGLINLGYINKIFLLASTFSFNL